MKTINEYLLSKSKKNAISHADIREYCLLTMHHVSDRLKNEIEKNFGEFRFPNNANSNEPDFYLITKEIAKEYEDEAGFYYYQIPDFCKTIEDVKSASEDGRLDVEELEELHAYE